jgi:hypothetical protein
MRTPFYAAVVSIEGTCGLDVRLWLGEIKFLEVFSDILVEGRLVFLEGEQVMGLCGDDLGGYFILTPLGL